MTIVEKAAYLKGLTEGLGVEPESRDGKLWSALNDLLHEYSRFIIGRMGVPYKERGISLISVMVDGPSDQISALSGKIGQLSGITSKAVYSKLPDKEAE